MNKLNVFLAAAVLVASTPAFACQHMKGERGMDSKMMDANGDGMISKDEFMKHHEMMWEKMKKNKSGMVDLADMHSMHKDGMHKDGMKEGKSK